MKMRYLLITLSILLLLPMGCGRYSVTEPYAYPVKPGTEEWDRLEGLQAKIEACSVSPGLMKKMTTSALADTIMEYPLLSDLIEASLQSTGTDSHYERRIKQAFSDLAESFQGVEMLKKREDAEREIKAYLLDHDLKEGDRLYNTASKVLEYLSFSKQ